MNFITLRDIRKGHPFGVSSPTDTYYVRIAKAVNPSRTPSCLTSPSIPTKAMHEADSWHKTTLTSWQGR